jgi:hypothetical protein
MNKKMPEWLELKDNGNYVVDTKDGKFELQDIEYEKTMKARKRITRTDHQGNESIDGVKFQMALISESLVEPKKGELEIMKLKSSSVIRLSYAINEMYDLQSFL